MSGSSTPSIAAEVPGPDAMLEAAERDLAIRLLVQREDLGLTRKQAVWLERFREEVQLPGKLNDAALAAEHGVNRSSATRAREALKKAFTRAGARELLWG